MKTIIISLFLMISCHIQAKSTPKDSIYQIQSKWMNQDSQSIALNDLAGQKVIMTMVYTGCAHACPMTIAKVEEIADALEKAGVSNFKLVMASFDTKNDTPEALNKYMKSRGLKRERWLFLSAPKETIARELAVVLGISYKDIGNGDFSHSNVISYLDEQGVVRAKIESLTADIDSIIKAAQKAGK